ncbi:hypothetical protein Tco_1057430 [Tanacetum coccineum]|uniref:Uncharacterized protein n=1 Tax=Tanacetum coccineum TaxID=301880 RepID=A0ABQ5H5C1_9ASTR
MSRATSLLSISSEEAIVPKDKQVGISSSNITSRKTKPTKAEKLPYSRFTKLIIVDLMSNNTAINQILDAKMHSELNDERFKTVKVTKKGIMQYGLQLPDTIFGVNNKMTNVVPAPPTDPPNTLDASRVWEILVLNPVDAPVVDAGGDLPGGFLADAPVVDDGGDLPGGFPVDPPVVDTGGDLVGGFPNLTLFKFGYRNSMLILKLSPKPNLIPS